jgi:hypothetical protein
MTLHLFFGDRCCWKMCMQMQYITVLLAGFAV